ncbi:MAG: thiamine biosynthesis protein ApbE [Salinivirgaceae bacterium]|nr:MAG: thiamine biosynthesis protein ApbE [Salinivirgaceae bacterium]
MKNLSILIIAILFIGCQPDKKPYIKNQGQAHGTFYHVSYDSPNGKDFHDLLKASMERIDKSLSTYDPISVISRINQNDSSVVLDDHFLNVYKKALEISKETHGAFDITVAPLVNAWGFGFTEPQRTDDKSIEHILSYTGYERVHLINGKLHKDTSTIQLDASAIAKGYSVDMAALVLENQGIKNYMVEIGGEIRVKGVNEQGNPWRIGIDEPTDDQSPAERKLQRIINISDAAMATSGNYRQFYIKNGKKYAHTINPKTGYPVQHSLLSASVVAPDCMTADAYATAFMVLGYHASKDIMEKHPEMEAYFILSGTDENTYEVKYTKGMEKFFK